MEAEEEEVQELTTDAQQFQMEEERGQQAVVEKREVQGSSMEERERVRHLQGDGFQQSLREEEEEEEEEEEAGVVQTQMKEEEVQRSPTVVVGEDHRVLDTETDGSEQQRRPDSPQFYLQEFDDSSEQQRRPDSPQFYLQEFDVRVVTSQYTVCVLAGSCLSVY